MNILTLKFLIIAVLQMDMFDTFNSSSSSSDESSDDEMLQLIDMMIIIMTTLPTENLK